MSRALGSGVPPTGGRGGGGRHGAGGDADTNSIHLGGRFSNHTGFSEQKLLYNLSAESLRELHVHKALGRATITHVARGKGEAHQANYALACELVSLDPLTGTYHVADEEQFVAIYESEHIIEQHAFEDRAAKVASAETIASLEKEALAKKQERALEAFRAKNDPKLRPAVEGVAPEEIKVAELIAFENALQLLLEDHRDEKRLLDAKAASQLLAIPRIGDYDSITEKAKGIYSALCSDAESFLTSTCSSTMLLAITRHVETELERHSEAHWAARLG